MGAAFALFAGMKAWPWGIIWRVALVIAVLGVVFFFGRYLYALGASDERATWEKRVSDLEQRAQDLAADAGRTHHRTTARIAGQLAEETEALQGVTDENPLAFLAVWRAADLRLCNAANAGEDFGT